MPFFADKCREADAATAETGRSWLDFDPFTFFSKGQNFQVLDIQVVSASNRSSDKAIVNVYPIGSQTEFDSKNIIVEAILNEDAGTYLITDFKDENGVSVMELAAEKR